MPRKKPEKAKKRMVLLVSEETAATIEAWAGNRTKGEALDEILQVSCADLNSCAWPKKLREDVRTLLLKMSCSQKERAQAHRTAGHRRKASIANLTAAAMELRALACLVDPTEQMIQSTVIQAMYLLREAAGYKRLPSLPDREGHAIESVH